jgi:hypothetical protein
MGYILCYITLTNWMGITHIWESHVNILVTKWTQLHSPTLSSINVCDQMSSDLASRHSILWNALCVGNCVFIISYHTSGRPFLTHQPPIINPSNATLPGHYPTLTIVELEGLQPRNIFPLRSTYNQQEHHPFSHHLIHGNPLGKYLSCLVKGELYTFYTRGVLCTKFMFGKRSNVVSYIKHSPNFVDYTIKHNFQIWYKNSIIVS